MQLDFDQLVIDFLSLRRIIKDGRWLYTAVFYLRWQQTKKIYKYM